jgi:hypothetical protein
MTSVSLNFSEEMSSIVESNTGEVKFSDNR